MPERMVIEDSDDEDNIEVTPPRHSAVAPSELHATGATNARGPEGTHEVEHSAGPSTGSTGLEAV